MTRGQKNNTLQKEFLSQSEIENLNDEKKELQSALREIESGTGAGTRAQIDPATLKRQIAQIEHAIQSRTPDDVRGAEKDKLVAEELELEEKIAEGMPTRWEMAQPSKNPGAVRKHMAWCNRNQQRIERYVKIQRILRPLEPKSIEVLRKEK